MGDQVAGIENLLRDLKEHDGSDLHLAAGLPPRLRRYGSIVDVRGWQPLSAADIEGMMLELVSDRQWTDYQSSGDLDFAHAFEGVARFRCNFLRQQNGPSAVFRIIPERILSLEDLQMPVALAGLADLHRGLVLVTGPTGSGKSTTMAAIVDRINRNYRKHIVTIENPIEFLHPNHESVFSQREVGTDTASFADALRAAMRQDADVILVGELRDLETIALAITAAEMGALVLATLHTNSAPKTVDRLVGVFPAKEQLQIRTTLAESLAGIVSQTLIPRADGEGRCCAVEILLRTQGLSNIIREANTPMLRSLMQSGRAQGMVSMDESIMALVDAGKITPMDAYLRATDKSEFEPLLDDASRASSA
jgi:twitching motility protein PilT